MADSLPKSEYGKIQSVILSASSREDAVRRAGALAAQVLCRSEGRRPCGQCASCRKIARGTHPDVITVRRLPDSKGGLKKEITVDQIRELSADAYILPNEADRKIYIIQEADRMNLNAQNAALKLLEEPPNGAVLLLCVTNPSALLPTVRSRCTEENLNGNAAAFEDETVSTVESFIRAVASRTRTAVITWSYAAESLTGDEFRNFLLCAVERVTDMLCGRRSPEGLTAAELLKLSVLLEECLRFRQANVSVRLLTGKLAAEAPGRRFPEEK